jgi:dienelactone hydrolase
MAMAGMLPEAVFAACVSLWAQTPLFDYDRRAPLDLREAASQKRAGAVVRDISFRSVAGGRTAAYLVTPKTSGPHAAILYVHWYEPESPSSNRTQFLEEAVTLAGRGAISLLIETMWSDPKWFGKRTRDGDFARSVQQVKELRRALDVLMAQPGVDPARVAYAGHDFGAMYGIVMGAVDKRPSAYVLMAGTTKFSDWYLLGPPKLQGAARAKFIEELAPLDPVAYLGRLSPAPVLLQFAQNDRYVLKARAQELFATAGEPKEIRWYNAGHGLNAAAQQDRVRWLTERLKLGR